MLLSNSFIAFNNRDFNLADATIEMGLQELTNGQIVDCFIFT